ncbi:fimbrial protein [Cronobacter malonaticus]|uniref:fimbrial protein n=1 Tax=Cronobacter malonaticus TaxID=413503 RepID=UPI000CFBB137|nr:fimbrial protein [Cronobacter malonaticus]ELY4597835.1 fimbrial protein [Cronobacter malonaticus]ELY5938197.1 fimbrial protein [Cronobacter malonaticus]ELY6203473.1 fimbrial protein [Cronobacter malonaticus]ELY6259568.1 fimbrial protein [Cronobacter malonaticus]MDT3562562.1 fimbrial protein [Cronobacter malonaticus]
MTMFKWCGVGLLLAWFSTSTFADQTTAVITVSVTINAAPCEINNNQNIDVDFGDSVITTDVTAGRVEKTIDYTLDCSNADTEKTLVMRIAGTGAEFNNDLLQTSIPELAVRLKADGADLPLNSDLPLASSTAKPVLVAALVGKPGARLPTGGFTAGATMTVDYQ